MELCTGFIRFAEIEDEIEAMIDLLQESGIHVVLVSYGFGCNVEDLEETEDIPVATSLLGDFLDRNEDAGIYPFGEADLEIRTEAGEIRFLLCHEGDVHCSGADVHLVGRVRARWKSVYGHSYEHEGEGTWKRLADLPDSNE